MVWLHHIYMHPMFSEVVFYPLIHVGPHANNDMYYRYSVIAPDFIALSHSCCSIYIFH